MQVGLQAAIYVRIAPGSSGFGFDQGSEIFFPQNNSSPALFGQETLATCPCSSFSMPASKAAATVSASAAAEPPAPSLPNSISSLVYRLV